MTAGHVLSAHKGHDATTLVTSTLLERTDQPWRCWCGETDCNDLRHCACGFAACAGHRVWGTE